MNSVIIHGGLALVGLVLAYLTWTAKDETERPAEEVTMIECWPDQLESVTLFSEEKTVKLSRTREGDTPMSWLEVTRKATKEGDPDKVSAFVGNHNSETYLEKIAPLRGLRSLGKVEGDVLAEVGLHEDDTHLAYTCAGQQQTIEIGKSTYGSGDRYARVEGKDEVFLLAGSVISDIKAADSRFMQRQLHRFVPRDVERIAVSGLGEGIDLIQRNRLTPGEAEWVDEAKPGQRNEVFGNWLLRVSRLTATEYLEPGAPPGSDLEETAKPKAPVSVMQLKYEGDDGELGQLEMQKVEAENATHFYARTETTRSWVKLPRSVANQAERSLYDVLGKEAPAEPEPAPSSAPKPPGRP